jgi:biopolymer transport protein ExbD
MSHGPSTEDNAEPNLMPLLDVVMQLLMFFILCADLKQANRKNPFVALPAAAAATPATPSGEGLIYVNLMVYNPKDFTHLDPGILASHARLFPPAPPGGQTVCYIVPATGNRNPMNQGEFESWIQTAITNHKNAKARDAKLPDMSICLRAAGVVQYGYVLETLQFCKKQDLKAVTTVNTHQKGNQ